MLGSQDGVFIAGYAIPIRHKKQHHQNACWATCLAMILEWAGFNDCTKEFIFDDAGPKIIPEYRYGDTATLAEIGYLSKKLTNNRVTFTRVDLSTVRDKDTFFWCSYINQFRPILFSMNNHCRILVGYNGVGQFLILDPAKESQEQPESMGIMTFRANVTDISIMNPKE